MASRSAYSSLVQRDATGPAEHSAIIGWVWLRCMLPFDCMPYSCSIVAPRCAPVQRALPEWQRWGRLHCFRFFISVASPRKHIPSRPSGGPVCSSSAVCVCWATSTCISEWQHSGCLRPQTTSIGGATLASDVYYANNKQGNGFHIPSPPPARPAWGGVFKERCGNK